METRSVVVLVLALGACNQVFGLDKTTATPPTDAKQFDAPADAPYACPAFPQQPAFSPFVHQIVAASECRGYSRSTQAANLAVAMCTITAGATMDRIEDGPIDASLKPTELLPAGSFAFVGPAIAPEGDQLWITRQDATMSTISVYGRSDPSWTWASNVYTLPVGDEGALLSPPTRAGAGRHILYVAGSVHELVEIAPGSWSEVRSYRTTALNMSFIRDASLSPDGLRMVFSGVTFGPGAGIAAVMYASRASIDDPFSNAGRLEGVPSGGESPFLTEDCGRVYFSGLGSVFYVAQL